MTFVSAVRALFLPAGYPNSVRQGYIEYQTWDVIQGLCSYLRGNLATRSTLIALGVGNVEASATSGALTKVFRDAASMIGSLLFTYAFANAFGKNIRQWRLFADVINDIGLTLAFVAPMFGEGYFLPITIAAGLCTSACGISAGATKAAISQWFALEDNLTDLVAKEGSQETAVNVLGLFGGWIMLTSLNSSGAAVAWSFAFLTALHVIANVLAIRHLKFDFLNSIRFDIVFLKFKEHYCSKENLRDTSRALNMSPQAVAELEPLLPWPVLHSMSPISVESGSTCSAREILRIRFQQAWGRLQGESEKSGLAAWEAFEKILQQEGWNLDKVS